MGGRGGNNIFHLDVHYVWMLVQHFEPQGRCFTNFHYYYYPSICLCQHGAQFGTQPTKPITMKLGVMIPWNVRVLSVYKVWLVPLVLINTNTWVERESGERKTRPSRENPHASKLFMPCRSPGSFVFLLRSADRQQWHNGQRRKVLPYYWLICVLFERETFFHTNQDQSWTTCSYLLWEVCFKFETTSSNCFSNAL